MPATHIERINNCGMRRKAATQRNGYTVHTYCPSKHVNAQAQEKFMDCEAYYNSGKIVALKPPFGRQHSTAS